ncbi:hypothetical protein PVL30_002610 [Lodderomyces elongisporus]|uniref:uncharacterized protein n=1 Tax=Lodderomyces elongisporus TaxID=36914 RepID=UPI00292297E8|nr:uncharacterized protein PVL30_002610 [Lodderomyces elongisporus]WLF78865.1 hypothetical protein PVL30_002610 [Lodderomyces elongisporus]
MSSNSFLKLCNYDDLVASMLPKKTKYWKYKEPLHPHPKLHYKVGDVEGAMDTGYIGVSHHSRDTSFAKSTNNLTSKRPSIATATNPDQLLNALYKDYQKRAFEVSKQSSRRTPPKFESLYPQDSFLLSKKELNHLNTKLLMNVLLRRTVAAKLEYRLNNNRGILLPHFIQKSLSSSSSSSTSSSASSSAHSLLSRTSSANSSSSSVASGVNNNDNNNDNNNNDDDDGGDGSGNDDDNGGYKKHHHTKPIYSKQTKQTGTPNSNSLYNNDDLILQNQSLFGSNVFFKSASSSPSRVSKSKRTHLNLISFAPEQPQGDTEITRKSGDTSNTGNTTIAGNHVQSLDPQSYKPESFIKHLNLRDSSNYTEPSIKNLHEKDLEQLEETVQPPKFSLQPRRQNSQTTLSSSEHSSTMFLTNESMLSVSFHSESNLNIIANSNANSNSDSNANSNTHLHGDTLHSAFSLASVSPVSSASKDKQIAPTVNIESTTTSPH